jgi:F-type H+-transporting ATPase subunit b
MNRSKLITAWVAGLAVPALALAAEVAEQGAKQVSILPTDKKDLSTAITTLVVFVLLLLILGKFAWGPILRGLNDREARIKKDLADAENARKAAETRLAEYQKQLADAEAKVRDLFAKATSDAEAAGTRIRMQAQSESEALKDRATKEIEEAKSRAIAQLHAEAANLATTIAGKILRRNITESDQSELIRSSLAELGNASKN